MRNLPNLWQGYNIYVNRDKFDLIDAAFKEISPGARSFADLGGVWKVNAAYTAYTIKKFPIDRAVLVDTDVPPALLSRLRRHPKLEVIQDDFASPPVVERVGKVDVILLFDVLLHQANPDWDSILERYSNRCSCFVIYNQQFVRGEETIRLTDLPLDEYIALTSDQAEELIHQVYGHRDEIHPRFGKPWKDIHNIAQWGITDGSLRQTMVRLGFREVFYRNYGMFLNLPAFEDHAFIFVQA